MQDHLYFVHALLLKSFPAREEAGVLALIPSTESKAKLQAWSAPRMKAETACALQTAVIAAFHHGAAWEEHCSIPSGRSSRESFAGRDRKAGKKAVRPRAAHPATASSNWDQFWHCSWSKRRVLLALFPRLMILFARDPASFHFLPLSVVFQHCPRAGEARFGHS